MQNILKLIKILFLFSLLINFKLSSIKIDRVIVSSDNNPLYIEFWPIVAKAWRELIGAKPTLALIANKGFKVDEECGDILRFDPLLGIPNSLYAQAVRLLVPAYFENDTCLISDIDIVPINKKFFSESIINVPDDSFVLYQMDVYNKPNFNRFPICYNVAKGKLFKEIFFINNVSEIPRIIKFWYGLNFGKSTDEIVLYKYLTNWKNFKSKFQQIDYLYGQRISRENWNFFKLIRQKLRDTKDSFIDIHCPRPHSKYKKEIDDFVKLLK